MLGFIVNCGSSSIKTRLIDTDTKETLFEARAGHLKTSSSTVTTKVNGISYSLLDEDNTSLTHEQALQLILNDLSNRKVIKNLEDISFVGHRIVHGGTFFSKPTIITEEVLEKITTCNELAPLHNPVGISGIRCCENLLSSAIHVAVFDTAFHQTIPEINFRYAIPDSWYDFGIRKYGFHGTSYSYLTRVLGNKIGKQNISAVMAHIGQGTSICAVSEGKSVYTSMEFSPLSGCIMGTRSGNIDPAVIQHLHNKFGYDINDILSTLNKESGLYAFTGQGNMLDILNGVERYNDDCIFALTAFCHSVAENMAKAIVSLGDKPKQIVFTGGIGENSPVVRKEIIRMLSPVVNGISLSDTANCENCFEITHKCSPIPIYVINANEELEIALEAANLLS